MVIGVTGATGLIGGYFAREALRQGLGIRFLLRSPSPESERLQGQGAAAVFGDLADAASLRELATGCETVVHSAAMTNLDASVGVQRATNLDGTSNVIEACRSASVKRVVHVSTPSVLVDGTHQLGIDEAHLPPDRPIGLYAETKLAGERLVLEARDFEAVIIRPKAVFGLGDRTLLPEVLHRIRTKRLVRVGRDPVQVGLTHASNVAQALLAAATQPKLASSLYHIDNGEAIDLWALLEVLKTAVSGDQKSFRSIPFQTCLAAAKIADGVAALRGGRTNGNQYRVMLLGRSQTLNIGAAQSELGYQPQISVAEGMIEILHETVSSDVAKAFASMALGRDR